MVSPPCFGHYGFAVQVIIFTIALLFKLVIIIIMYTDTHHLPWRSERVSISSFRFVFFSDKINYLGRFTSFFGITQVTY